MRWVVYVVVDLGEGCSVVNGLLVVDGLTLSEVGCRWEAVKNNGIPVGGRIISSGWLPHRYVLTAFGELPPPPYKPVILLLCRASRALKELNF